MSKKNIDSNLFKDLKETLNIEFKTDVDLKILDENNNVISQSTSGTRNLEITEFEIPKTGDYKFQAFRYDSNENNLPEVVITYVKK
ncbi:hypothetical protein [Mesomycoplasma hyopneumoniae]|uniref:hypothetical protein n=1 Tax=Mesomycoplasma hyopneumoniae TaxID=2099 RepID=UPI003DA5E600